MAFLFIINEMLVSELGFPRIEGFIYSRVGASKKHNNLKKEKSRVDARKKSEKAMLL